ncbi:MAG: DNA-3-methyladenine glycosylase I [Actinobacteria bacterium]|nr:DNA-3-methyladenine glycosylase I [Actinomycetota bacterium]
MHPGRDRLHARRHGAAVPAAGRHKRVSLASVTTRCGWVPENDALYVAYHDDEWGVPVRDERGLFELLTLEGAQAGLSWSTILHKRDGYRRLFAGFDADTVARYDEADVEQLLADPAIVRNRLKVESTVANARAILALRESGESLAALIWSVVGGEQRRNAWRSTTDVPAETDESRALARELKRSGFRFVGPTTCYALMQAAGLVDDHVTSCFRHGAA